MPAASANVKVPLIVHSPRELWPLPSDERSARNLPMSHLLRCKIHHIHTKFPKYYRPCTVKSGKPLEAGFLVVLGVDGVAHCKSQVLPRWFILAELLGRI